MLRRLLFILMVLSASPANAGDPPLAIGFQAQYGFLIAHRPSIVHLIRHHVPSAEFYFERPVSGKKNWHIVFRQPSIGISLYGGDLGNRDVLGMGYALLHYAKFNFLESRRSSFTFRIGSGIGYVENIFERLENNRNIAIGSHFNVAFNLQAQYKFSFEKSDLGIGISIMHFSNGAFSMPNLGLNLPSAFLSWNWKKGNHQRQVTPVEQQEFSRSNSAGVVLSGGAKEINPPGTRKYAVVSLQNFFIRNVNPKTGLGGGIDIMYTPSTFVKYRQHVGEPGKEFSFIQVGMNGAYELNMDELKLFINIGAYVISKYKEDGPLYHRFGLRYHFNNRLIASFALKTHWAKADYLEFGIGYKIVDGK